MPQFLQQRYFKGYCWYYWLVNNDILGFTAAFNFSMANRSKTPENMQNMRDMSLYPSFCEVLPLLLLNYPCPSPLPACHTGYQLAHLTVLVKEVVDITSHTLRSHLLKQPCIIIHSVYECLTPTDIPKVCPCREFSQMMCSNYFHIMVCDLYFLHHFDALLNLNRNCWSSS
jgi:hypothetical protein